MNLAQIDKLIEDLPDDYKITIELNVEDAKKLTEEIKANKQVIPVSFRNRELTVSYRGYIIIIKIGTPYLIESPTKFSLN